MTSRVFQILVTFFATTCSVLSQEGAKSVDDRVRELEKAIGNHEPTENEKAQEQENRRRDLEEIKALGLPDRALIEFTKRNPKATVKEWSANYFRTKEIVMMSIIYSDPEAKVAQQEIGFRKKKKDWEMIWQVPSVLDHR